MISVRVDRYRSESDLMKLLKALKIKLFTINSRDIDMFHKRMGTPDYE